MIYIYIYISNNPIEVYKKTYSEKLIEVNVIVSNGIVNTENIYSY